MQPDELLAALIEAAAAGVRPPADYLFDLAELGAGDGVLLTERVPTGRRARTPARGPPSPG